MKEHGVKFVDELPRLSDMLMMGDMKPFDWNHIPPGKVISAQEAKKKGIPLGCPLVKKQIERDDEDEKN